MFTVSYSIGYMQFFLQGNGEYEGGYEKKANAARETAYRFANIQEASEFARLYKGHVSA